MECMQSTFEFLCKSFPQIDIRLIKATVLEHGDDVGSSIKFLKENTEEVKDVSCVSNSEEESLASANLAGDLEQQVRTSPSEAVSTREEFTEMELVSEIDQQTRDLLSQSNMFTKIKAGHDGLRDNYSEGTIAQIDGTNVVEKIVSQDYSAGLQTPLLIHKSGNETSTSLMHGQCSRPSEQSSRLSSGNILGEVVSVSGGSVVESQTRPILGFKATASQGYSAHLQTLSANIPKIGGQCNEFVANTEPWEEAGVMFGDSFQSETISRSSYEDASVLGTSSWSSQQNISVVLLEDILQEARTDKESLIKFIEEISTLRAKADQENIAAQRVKSEAGKGGQDTLVKAEEMRKQIAQMEEENLMRGGEIYGEKAVLATEARELMLRLEQVKQQKDKAFATLTEIKAALQDRFDLAVQERERAEEEKKVREKYAQEVLAREEARMAAITQDSENLDLEAEACTRLREFLIDHGSFVDSLQGEMGVLCEDVETFKKQVEDGMWLTGSTVGFPSGITPEGPYSFRRSNRSSATSSQDLAQKLQILTHVKDDGRAEIPSKKGLNRAAYVNDGCNSRGSSCPNSFGDLTREASSVFIHSVHADPESSISSITPEPSMDVSETRGMDFGGGNLKFSEGIGMRKGSTGVDSNVGVDTSGDLSDCLNSNEVYDTARDFNRTAINIDMGHNLDTLSFQDPTAVSVTASSILSESVLKSESFNDSSFGSYERSTQSGDDAWQILKTGQSEESGLSSRKPWIIGA